MKNGEASRLDDLDRKIVQSTQAGLPLVSRPYHQIADELGITERTVKAHVSALFEKLGVRNRTQAGVLLQSLTLADPARSVEPDA